MLDIFLAWKLRHSKVHT